MATRYAAETGRNWPRFVPNSQPDVLLALPRMRRVPRASAAFDYYTAHRARCFRPVTLPRVVQAPSFLPLQVAA
jgi:hypothetical protein